MALTLSNHLREALAEQMENYSPHPRRSKGTQLLRDAALGHREFPDAAKDGKMNMTATEIQIRMTFAERAAVGIARDLDNHILDSLKYSMVNSGKVRIVSSS